MSKLSTIAGIIMVLALLAVLTMQVLELNLL